jgi:hypothetical protein
MFERSVPGVEDDRQVETLAHYVEMRVGRQCPVDHFCFNSWSLTKPLEHKDLSF